MDPYGVYFSAYRYHPFSTGPHSKLWWQDTDNESRPEPKITGQHEDVPEFSPSDAEESEHLPSRRVHIHVAGVMGIFMAHSLKCLPNPPPISLLMPSEKAYTYFQHANHILRVINKNSRTNDEQRGYDVDLANIDEREKSTCYWRFIADRPGGRPSPTPVSPEEILPSGEVHIYTLILCGKSPKNLHTLRLLQHRISSQTTICILQNGLGQVEELNRHIFTDPETRPTYMYGVSSHQLRGTGRFAVVHTGVGSMAVGVVRDLDKYPLPPKSDHHALSESEKAKFFPTRDQLWSQISSRYLLRTLTRSPILVCAALPHLDLFQLQLEKLAVDCIIEPLTTLLRVAKNTLTLGVELRTVARLLTVEVCAVIQRLPELQGLPNVRHRFSAKRLEELYLQECLRPPIEGSSREWRNLKRADFEYHNGYIVKRGEELGLQCVLNYLIQSLVAGRSDLLANQKENTVPFGQLGVMTVSSKTPPVSMPVQMVSHQAVNGHEGDLDDDGLEDNDLRP